MSFILTKLLPLCLYPLGTAILLVILSRIMSWLGWRRGGSILLLVALAYLWAMSTPIVGENLLARIETAHPQKSLADTPPVDVAVVLGGVVGYATPPRLFRELNDNAGRVIHTARLYHAGRMQQIIVTGGNYPWGPDSLTEAEQIRDQLVEWGVPQAVIHLETESLNTYQNAINTRSIYDRLDFRSGMLVTSAFHMQRSLATFQKAGFDLVPISSGVKIVDRPYRFPLDYLPQDSGLSASTRAIKEWIGMAVYRLRGWM